MIHAQPDADALLRLVNELQEAVIILVARDVTALLPRHPRRIPAEQLALDLRTPRKKAKPQRTKDVGRRRHRVSNSDIAAFQSLSRASPGTAERALFALLTRDGLGKIADKLQVDAPIIVDWVRAGVVPPSIAPLVTWHARGVSTYQGQRGVDPRRAKVAEMVAQALKDNPQARIPVTEIAATVGVSRQTVTRWASNPEPKRLGRPKKRDEGNA